MPVALDHDGELRAALEPLAQLEVRYAVRPRVGTTVLTEVDSFIAHVQRWGSDARSSTPTPPSSA